MYIVEKNFGNKQEAKQKTYEQSVAHYTKAAKRFGAVRPCRGHLILKNER